jgi:hypothetical protein
MNEPGDGTSELHRQLTQLLRAELLRRALEHLEATVKEERKREDNVGSFPTPPDPFSYLPPVANTGTPTNTQENPHMSDNNAARSALEETRKEVLKTLEKLGRVQVGDDDLVFKGTKFVLPEQMSGDIPGAVRYLVDYQEQQEAEFDFSRTFNYRPWDGAAAFDRAMIRVFGSSGIGKITPGGLFSPDRKPEYITIPTGPGTTIQVPWGRVAFSPLKATFQLGGVRKSEMGAVFYLSVEAPRKYRAHLEAFFQIVQDELEQRSIYKGKAFTGADEPTYLDTRDVDPSKVVYSHDVMVQLDTNLWSVLKYTDNMRSAGIPIKRSVLLEGPYGTGKSLAGQLTAVEAVKNGWTFIICRPGKDKLETTLQTAQIYAPSVVWFEDIDVVAEGRSNEQVSELLDSLDGITNKGTAVVAAFTTNHVEKIQKGVLRPGRLDAVIHIGELDAEGMEKLIKATLPVNLQGVIDFATVVKAYAGFLPAFAKEATDRALRYAISRGHGVPSPVTTDDLVNAANGLRPQLRLMKEATEGVVVEPLAAAVRRTVQEAVTGVSIVDHDDDEIYKLIESANANS